MKPIPLNAATLDALGEFQKAIDDLAGKRSIYLQALLDAAGVARDSKWTLDQIGKQLLPVEDTASATATVDTTAIVENDKPAKAKVKG